MSTIKQLKAEFDAIEKIKIFEIEVINKITSESDYVIFDLSIQKNTLIAQHVALTAKQETSKKIAFESLVLDSVFSLDEHLQTMYEQCTGAIMESEFFTLS